MPRFYLDVQDRAARPDREGTELPGPEAARSEALRLAGELVRDAGIRGDPLEERWIDVTDATGATIFLAEFVVMQSQPRPGGGSAGRPESRARTRPS